MFSLMIAFIGTRLFKRVINIPESLRSKKRFGLNIGEWYFLFAVFIGGIVFCLMKYEVYSLESILYGSCVGIGSAIMMFLLLLIP